MRIFNFSAGPAVLPEEVLAEAKEALWELGDTGIGVMEHSHRGKAFTRIIEQAEADCRSLAGIGDDHRVLFLQGGASLQFAMLPANFLAEDRTADYIDTGSWSAKAAKEARLYGNVQIVGSSKEQGYDRIPAAGELSWSKRPAYAHFTSNNTIYGTQWRSEPEAPASAFLACDASSDIFSRPIDLGRYGLLYAGAQKNLGPSGVVLVVVRGDLVERPVRELPSMLRYATSAESGSLYNTPPTFAIYVAGLVFQWIARQGGLAAVETRNKEKAGRLYDAIDASDFYEGTAQRDSRSLMNVTFRTPDPDTDARFVAEATEQGLAGLKGHRSVGGMRASIYNAFPRAGCEALAQFMKDFAAKHG